MAQVHSQRNSPSVSSRIKHCVTHGLRTIVHHLKRHVGVGIVCSVAYFDPGNWSVDLQAGSSFGYRPMLFVVLMAGLCAIVFQILSCKLGCVTGLDLASHCRLLLHDHPRHPRLVRWLVLYPLYVLSEIAIISTDLAELLGSAIGFCLLIPKLPLCAGVVLTAADVLIFLSFSDPSRGQGRPVRVFEITIIGLVLAVFSCFVVRLVKASPDWSQVFIGYIPNKGLFQSQPDAVYTAVGILGATVMPHALFLGSSLATQDRVTIPRLEENLPPPASTRAGFKAKARKLLSPLFRITHVDRTISTIDYRTKYGERDNNSLTFISQHLPHGIADVATSLIALAIPINSAILILAAAVFSHGPDNTSDSPAGLFEAHDFISNRLGNGAGVIFALALVCAGQTSSITVTLAGQIVSEGFVEWKVSPFLRRLITRCISLVPSVVVAVAVGREGINTLLFTSQVVLSVVLPFVAFPLIYLTSQEAVMRVQNPTPEPELVDHTEKEPGQISAELEIPEYQESQTISLENQVVQSVQETVDFSNGLGLASLAYVIWCIVVVANTYAIVMLCLR